MKIKAALIFIAFIICLALVVVARQAASGTFSVHKVDFYENNDDWIGVGTLENASLNNRVYLRLAAKHYPKGGAPVPLRSLNVSYNNLIVRRTRGPVYQDRVSNDPGRLLR